MSFRPPPPPATDANTAAAFPSCTPASPVCGAAADDLLFLSGNWNAATQVFTITANGAGADTLIIDVETGTATSRDLTTNTSMFLLQGVDSDDLVAADFI